MSGPRSRVAAPRIGVPLPGKFGRGLNGWFAAIPHRVAILAAWTWYNLWQIAGGMCVFMVALALLTAGLSKGEQVVFVQLMSIVSAYPLWVWAGAWTAGMFATGLIRPPGFKEH